MNHDYALFARRLTELLGLSTPPIAIAFRDDEPKRVFPFKQPMPSPTSDGRTGRVPAGCVFWTKAENQAFSTVAEDHANCSVGSLTHGFKSLQEVATNSDVGALVESGWVSTDVFPQIPTVAKRSNYVLYGPLSDIEFDPDVILLRLNGKQLMTLHDAWPTLRFEGKPQCHIIPIAKVHRQIAVSVGCMLSRVRTGMSNNHVSCAAPAQCLPELLTKIAAAKTADDRVAVYASEDSKRFR